MGYTDEILRNHIRAIKLHEILNTQLMILSMTDDVKVQSYEERVNHGMCNIRSPVEEYMYRKERLKERIKALEMRIIPVNEMTEAMTKGSVYGPYRDGVMLKILKWHYWNEESIRKLCERLRLSRYSVMIHRDNLRRITREYVKRHRQKG